MHILLIDDDIELCELLTTFLNQESHSVDSVHNVATSLIKLDTVKYDVIILDVMLPDGSGLELLKTIRTKHTQIPILMLSARGEPLDKTLGLELGADDYLAKPYDMRELSARLRAIVRRNTHKSCAPIIYDDLTFDVNSGKVTINKKTIILTITEGQILIALLKQPNVVIDKQSLALAALGRKLTAFDRSLDMHVSNLRKKLGSKANGEPRILSSRGRGYYYNA